MKAFIRDNLMIVVSVALPLLVVVVFALATLVPRWLVEPPQYDFLMTAEWPGSRGALPVRIDMSVTDGKLRVRAFRLENGGRAYAPRLFEFVAATQSVREIMLDWPDDLTDLPDGTVIGVPEFDSVASIPRSARRTDTPSSGSTTAAAESSRSSSARVGGFTRRDCVRTARSFASGCPWTCRATTTASPFSAGSSNRGRDRDARGSAPADRGPRTRA